jgi:hypothetical protein
VDAAGNLYVANYSNHTITVFGPGASGNVAPIRTISGPMTGLSNPSGIALNPSGNLYVANDVVNSVVVFAPGAAGNVTPIRTLSGPSTGINRPAALALGR